MSDQPPIPSYSAPANEPVPGAASVAVAPSQVNIAFWLYLVNALLSLVSIIIAVASAGATKTALQTNLAGQGQHLSDRRGQPHSSTCPSASRSSSAWCSSLLTSCLPCSCGGGANWARIILLILTVLTLFQITSGYGVGALRIVIGVVATILIFLRAGQ